MVNHSESPTSTNKETHVNSSSSFNFDTNQSQVNSSSSFSMAPNSIYNEDRNILVCGSKGSGKTSLIFTISRGIFPGSFSPDLTPGRFEGWSIGASAIPVSASSPSKSSTSSNSSYTQGGKEKVKPYNVSLTFWEDRPRLNLDIESSSSSSSEDEETNDNRPGTSDKSKLSNTTNGNNVSDLKESKTTDKGTPLPLISHAHVHHIYGQQRVHHRLGRRRSSTKLAIKNGAKQPPKELVVPFATSSQQPRRIWPIPEPHVIVICYSSTDTTSFIEVGTEIVPELNQRFPNVPRILVATKEDLKTNISTLRSVGSGLSDLNIDSKLHSCSTEKASIQPSESFLTPSKMDKPLTNTMGTNTNTKDTEPVTSEMGYALKRKIGARAFIECSAKNHINLRTIVEEAVLVSFDSWLQRNSSSSKCSKLSKTNQKVERKWSLAAQLSSSFPMHSWSNMSVSRDKSVEGAIARSSTTTASRIPSQNTVKVNASHLSYDQSSSPRLAVRSQSGDISARPVITIQDPFSSQCFAGINSASSQGSLTSSFVGNRQRKQSYGRAAVRKIWHTYSGGGGSNSSTTGNSISSSSSSSSAASTVASRKGKS